MFEIKVRFGFCHQLFLKPSKVRGKRNKNPISLDKKASYYLEYVFNSQHFNDLKHLFE